MTREPRRDINAVLADHDRHLMSISGVVGVYVGEEKGNPCLRVMLARKDPAIESQIPRTLEGYPVRIEISGEIRPF